MARSTKAETSTWGIPPAVRAALRTFVLRARHLLEDDFRRQLVALRVSPEGAGSSASDPDTRAVLAAARAVMDRLRGAGVTSQEALDTFVRDSAFTFLNRLVGLRCLEERGMLRVDGKPETALARDPRLGASSLYFRARNELPPEAGPREVWRAALDRAFRAISEELGELFDPASEYGQLFPLANTMRELADAFNDPAIPPEVWADDEVLGWVYQYYNAEEKDAAYAKLKKGGKLEGPEELAAATCLYTERYMVDYLLQNTLGALWLEMHPESQLPDRWPYFVRFSEGAPRRPDGARPERLRDLTLLDPACGGGHFLARAFDLLVEMYREEGLEAEEDIPRLILERNLYGIDIDLRAVQIAALRLYLKACEFAGPGFRPRRLNLVATDVALPAVPPTDLLDRFRGDTKVQALITGVWSELRDAAKLGSLLHPERRVREALAERRAKGPTLEFPDEETWERFALALLEQIRETFDREARVEDVGRRLFGKDLEKGLSLVEAVTRRYHVVVTNPPYAGSKNLDPEVKGFVEREYAEGKRDLYAAFILRCLEFARPGGHVGMVTQQSWLFLRSFAKLRERVLRDTTVTTLAHLGEHGFEETAAAGANVALFTLRAQAPAPEHRMTAFRLVGPKSPAEKDRLLRLAIADQAVTIVSTPKQSDLQAIPETPFAYGLRPRLLELLRGRRLSDVARIVTGPQVGDDERFVRFFWEPSPEVVGAGGENRRYVPFEKGGGYCRWMGNRHWVVEWSNEGAAIRSHPSAGFGSDEYYFRPGWGYSCLARGSIGLRRIEGALWGRVLVDAVFPLSDSVPVGAILNSRAASFVVRWLRPQIVLSNSYVARIPHPEETPPDLLQIERACVAIKALELAPNPTERLADPAILVGSEAKRARHQSFGPSVLALLCEAHAWASLRHCLEAWNEQLVFGAYAVATSDVSAILDETGTPAGWHPLIAGYDRVPEPPADIELPEGFVAHFASLERRQLSPEQLDGLKGRLRKLYEAGPGATTPDEAPDADEEAEETVLGARIPIPTETFLEELSQKLQIHPVSVYNLLQELHAEGVYSPPEVRRLMEDWVSVALLLMLGFRWPEQDRQEAETGPAIDPDLVDPDGIIPLVPCGDQPTAEQRLRTLLERRFGEEGAARSLEEFRTWVGSDLGRWLERAFFARHIKQFKYRPIAWHLTSPEGTFQAFVLYHRLSREMLQRLRDIYAASLITRLRAELEGASDDATKQELRFQIEDVQEFRERIKAIEEGRELRHRIRCRWKEELEEGRPGPFAPDTDDGVKVNIRPFQETGLLAREVIKKW